jgi:hypothetical protein
VGPPSVPRPPPPLARGVPQGGARQGAVWTDGLGCVRGARQALTRGVGLGTAGSGKLGGGTKHFLQLVLVPLRLSEIRIQSPLQETRQFAVLHHERQYLDQLAFDLLVHGDVVIHGLYDSYREAIEAGCDLIGQIALEDEMFIDITTSALLEAELGLRQIGEAWLAGEVVTCDLVV